MTSSSKKFDIFKSNDFIDFWGSLNFYGQFLSFVFLLAISAWFTAIFYTVFGSTALLIDIKSNTLVELYWFTLGNKLRRMQTVSLTDVKKINCNCMNEYYDMYTFEYNDESKRSLRIEHYKSEGVRSTLYNLTKKPIEIVDTTGTLQYPGGYQ